MPSEFQVTKFSYGDDAGFGFWLVSHYRQHLRYNNKLASLATPINISVFPILTVDGGRDGLRHWLDSHEKWHELIRPFAGVSSINLADVDFRKQEQFYAWLDLHAQEHAELDVGLGVT